MDLSLLFEGGSIEMQKKKRITFYTICATLALMIALLLTLAVFGLVSLISNGISASNENAPISIGATETKTFNQSDVYKGDLLILDATHPLASPATVVLMKVSRPTTEAGMPVYTINGIENLCLRSDALKQFNSMAEDFYKQSKDDNLIVFNAYDESKSSQSALYESGTTVALGYYTLLSDNTYKKNESIYGVGTYNWIYNNAHRYGFVVMPSDDGSGSNVFRYVGLPHALAMSAKNLSFEGYLEYLKSSTSPDSPLAVSSSTRSYAIYYLPAKGPHKVPTEYGYTVSGNNADGFIVTVDISAKKSK